jgi:KipI family sensor histidine kinase inhibitor
VTPRLVRYGDRAWLVEYEPPATPDLSARILRLTDAIRVALADVVGDVVPGLTTICVHARTPADAGSFASPLQLLLRTTSGSAHVRGRLIELPVAYGGGDGPDLDAVAEAAGLTPAEVIRRHAAPTYHVFMLGFMPGFPYLGPVDEAIRVPRLGTPRLRVAAGSVGLAGAQTGIYPRESPGGWRIIGRTPEWLFDPARTPPTRLAPGDRVRFIASAATPRPL